MKKYTLALTFFLAVTAWAQTPPAGMPSEADMQKMMQGAQRMAACMAGVDQGRLEELAKEAEAVSEEIQAHCAEGDSSAAITTAIAFGRKMQADPDVQKIQSCTAGMGDMMSDMLPDYEAYAEAAADNSDGGNGICD